MSLGNYCRVKIPIMKENNNSTFEDIPIIIYDT